MRSIVLANQCLRAEFLPDCGGKLASLVDLRHDKEWLWRNPGLVQKVPTYGDSFVEQLDTGGWDEILPTVDPCELDGQPLPDHGDLAALPWQVEDVSDTVLTMSVTCRYAPLRFRRRVRLDGNSLHFDYELHNEGKQSVPWNWFAHPILPLEPGSRLDIPEGTPFEVFGGGGAVPGSWPHAGGIDYERSLDEGEPTFGRKLMIEGGFLDHVSFYDPAGRSFRMEWDPGELPVLALWINQAGWCGVGTEPYRNIGIEPGVFPYDSLTEACRATDEVLLGPGERRTWSLQVRLEG